MTHQELLKGIEMNITYFNMKGASIREDDNYGFMDVLSCNIQHI